MEFESLLCPFFQTGRSFNEQQTLNRPKRKTYKTRNPGGLQQYSFEKRTLARQSSHSPRQNVMCLNFFRSLQDPACVPTHGRVSPLVLLFSSFVAFSLSSPWIVTIVHRLICHGLFSVLSMGSHNCSQTDGPPTPRYTNSEPLLHLVPKPFSLPESRKLPSWQRKMPQTLGSRTKCAFLLWFAQPDGGGNYYRVFVGSSVVFVLL